MKLYIKYFCLLVVLLSGMSCKKFLDVTPDNVGTIEYAFRNRNEAENYLFTCYSTMQQLSDVVMNAGFTASSDIIYPDNLANPTLDATGFNLIRGKQNTGTVGLNFWEGTNSARNMFQALRRCNDMLANIDKPVDLGSIEKVRWIAEVKFLKAYYHFILLRMYGPIPLIKVNLPISASAEEVRVKRQPTDECFAYVVQLLDEAIPDLPPVISNQATELGRATRVMALSLKAQILATAASPLFNGNPDYAAFTDQDQRHLFSTTYDATKWKKAADACKAAILEAEQRGLKLYNFVPPSAVNDSLKRVLNIQVAVTEKWEVNTELIWGLNYGYKYQGYAIPRMTQKSISNASANPSNFAVPVSTQELFYTDKGLPITEDRTWDYVNRYTLKTGDVANMFYIRKDYETVKAHFNREPRFYADLAFDGAIWYGNGNISDIRNLYYVQARGTTSLAGPRNDYATNLTGYWPKKTANYLSIYDDGFQEISYRLPVIRLAGMYLLYAETLNEAEGPTEEVYTYIDRVRARAGIPGVREAWNTYAKNPGKAGSKDGLRDIIHQETRIELCFEGQIGWDLRRWKELQAALSKPLQGWNIKDPNPANYYRLTNVVIPVFGIRDYLWPIESNTLIVNSNLVQNPYW